MAKQREIRALVLGMLDRLEGNKSGDGWYHLTPKQVEMIHALDSELRREESDE
jgi:hypothetical protein